MSQPVPPSILEPARDGYGKCGYCKGKLRRPSATSNYSTGAWPIQLSCEVYQKMIDRGWRRSGEYLYKQELHRSCCPQYTIRLDVTEFKANKTQRKLLSKFNRFVIGEAGASKKKPHSGRTAEEFDLIQSLHSAESGISKDAEDFQHKFTVTLEPSSFTDEKFKLYSAYQAHAHDDHDKNPGGFTRFLVTSPLLKAAIPYTTPPPAHLGLPKHYGSYHQLYRVDGELIAIGVLDILPACVSSVYLIYSPKWAWASLGKLSALREIALAQEIRSYGVESMGFQYMGFYIHSCSKMRYKADYQPSYLLDPEAFTWHKYSDWLPLLDAYRYASIVHPEHSLDALRPNSPRDGNTNTSIKRGQGDQGSPRAGQSMSDTTSLVGLAQNNGNSVDRDSNPSANANANATGSSSERTTAAAASSQDEKDDESSTERDAARDDVRREGARGDGIGAGAAAAAAIAVAHEDEEDNDSDLEVEDVEADESCDSQRAPAPAPAPASSLDIDWDDVLVVESIEEGQLTTCSAPAHFQWEWGLKDRLRQLVKEVGPALSRELIFYG